jgi:predicted amidophosphoribosyltransferase
VLIDSCRICGQLSWSQKALCSECYLTFFKKDFLIRHQNELTSFSLMSWEGAAKKLVKKCKNAEDAMLIKNLGEIIVKKLVYLNLPEILGIIPVPSKSIGSQDHAFMLGYIIAMKLNKAFLPGYLHHLGGAKKQKNSGLSERKQVKICQIQTLPKSSSGVWVLVDDVITTGMTLLESHKALGYPAALSLTLASREYK